MLSGDLENARELADNISYQRFNMYCTRNLDKAKRYCYNRYFESTEKRYGLVASSKNDILPSFGVDNTYNTTSNLDVGLWFNDNPISPSSCCQMTKVATEFACQGLELDMPILCWESDLKWTCHNWRKYSRTSRGVQNPHQLRINSYRVLLTRGRDGFIVYVPDVRDLDAVFHVMLQAGVYEL